MNGLKNGAAECRLQWKVGLVNFQTRYLTAETFGCKINASGTTMRKKQLWIIEHDPTEDDTVYIRSHLGRYLAGDKRGNVTCSSEEIGEAERFSIQYHTDGSGRWAVRNRVTGYYFGGAEDSLKCYEKQPGQSEWWTVHLAIHPQVNLRNLNRQKYAFLDPTTDRLQVTALIPWGQAALVTLEFRDGRYCVRSSDGRYLHRDGSLVSDPSPDTSFSLEIKSGQFSGLALKDCTGKYLTAVGREAVMQARNKSIGKDELFTIEDSHPQVIFKAHNGKMVSIRQGVDPTANQDDEVTDRETFQVEFDKKAEQWRILTADNKYWSLEAASGIQAIGNAQSGKGLFSLEWLDDGAAAIKASNGKYLTARMNGSLYAVSDEVSEKERFLITIINKPRLVLKCDYGFVGLKTPTNPRYECNRATYDSIILQHAGDLTSAYHLQSHNGKYWMVDGDGNMTADSVQPVPFIFEMRGQSRMTIKCPNGNYISGEQNGIMAAKSNDLEKATFWEY